MRSNGIVGWIALTLSVGVTGCGSDRASSHPDDRTTPAIQTGFVQREATLKDGSKRRYSVFIPRDYDPAKRWPTVMFLQGLGEGGSDGKKQTTVGLGPSIRKREKSFELIAIFPQSGGLWSTDDADRIAMACLDDVEAGYRVDTRRVYLTGMSTGGYGVWKIGARHADRFAALAPLCARTGEDHAEKLTRTPIWAFHNAWDPIVWSGATKDTVSRIKQLGGNARSTIYGSVGHDCWTRTYGDPNFWTWMLAQKKA